jgi:DNA (cytosine-5)-methyltransferase 1
MNHGSLFSGIGGFDLAAEWAGWTNKFHCEWNPFGQKVLKYYWPKAESYTDITKTNFSIWRGKIDILTGGFPCQPYSAAGKRLGKEDDRHLWPEMLRAIREIQPTWVVGENVLGLVNWNGGLVFDEVQADLEAEGYEVQPYVLPAVSVNAPHRRDRVWFVAYSVNNRYSTRRKKKSKQDSIQSEKRTAMDAWKPNRTGFSRDTANTDSNSRRSAKSNFNEEREHIQCRTSRFSIQRITSDTSNQRLQRGEFNGSPDTKGKERRKQPSGSATQFHQVGDWRDFPTQSPICTGNDGVSSRLDGITFPKWRNESIKAGGNAIVPQVVYQIFKVINEYESNYGH